MEKVRRMNSVSPGMNRHALLTAFLLTVFSFMFCLGHAFARPEGKASPGAGIAFSVQEDPQQQGKVHGRVIDVNDKPIPGVTVAVKGTAKGTITDSEGNFELEDLGVNPVLIFSFVGMKTIEIPVGGKETVNVTMKEETIGLDEIVAVGYGTQKKASLVGAVSQIKGDDLLTTPATNITSVLGGRLPGIQSVQTSGQPGEDGASLTIRGSIYTPTYIVDGIPRSIDEIDPNDIESVSVLKDGAAAAVYGLKGAGGVIIITTKKGHKGETQITYDGSFGISRNANFPEFLNGPDFVYYYNKGLEMDGDDVVFTEDEIEKMKNGDDSDGWGNTNWMDKVFGTGKTQKHNVTVQGGTDKMTYFTSLGYMDQCGNINNFDYDRYNLRTNIESEFAQNWKFSLGMAAQLGQTSRPGYEAGSSGEDGDSWMTIVNQAIGMHPYLPVKYDGMYTATPNASDQPNSPLAAINESGKYKSKTLDLQSNLMLQYDVPWVKGLNFKLTAACDYESTRSKNLDTPYYVMIGYMPESTSSDITYDEVIDPRGVTYYSLGEGLSENTQLDGQGSINYKTTIAGNHHIDAMALLEIRDYRSSSFAAYGKSTSTVFETLDELDYAQAADSPISGSSDHTRTAGYVTRIRYDFKDTYLAEFAGRYDGSYKFFGEKKRWGFFPSFSAGWRISNENFMKQFSFIDNLKLRASVGMLGNDDVDAYEYMNKYEFSSDQVIGGSLASTLQTDEYANTNLSWERTLSYNAGFDLTMWKGLLNVTLDGFYTYTYDILTSMDSSYPPSMGGYYPTYENYSKVDGRGFEISLTHSNHVGSGPNTFRYNVGFNLTYAESRWLRYPDSSETPDYQKLTGKAVGSKLGWKTDGLYQSDDEIETSPWPFGEEPRAGDIKYVDINGDGVVEYQDKAYDGKSNTPRLVGGLNLSGSWRGFDMNVQLTGAAICDVSLTGTYYNGYDDNTIYTQSFKEGGNSPRYLIENAWRPDHTSGTYPRLTVNDPHNNNGLASTFWFRDGKYLRLKSTQIGYSLPKTVLDNIGIQKLRIYVEGSNLLTLSGLPEGIDPESPTVNNGYYPQQRTFMAGVTLSF